VYIWSAVTSFGISSTIRGSVVSIQATDVIGF
jgi:hypothetical protein